MSIIELAKDDPIVRRARSLKTSELTEIGMIPGDECGCKIYACNEGGRLNMIAMHSKSYGCSKRLDSDTILIRNPPTGTSFQLMLNFDSKE